MIFIEIAQSSDIGGVNCWDDREVVLVFVEVVFGRGECAIERVLEIWIERSEGEFIDVVRKVES